LTVAAIIPTATLRHAQDKLAQGDNFSNKAPSVIFFVNSFSEHYKGQGLLNNKECLSP